MVSASVSDNGMKRYLGIHIFFISLVASSQVYWAQHHTYSDIVSRLLVAIIIGLVLSTIAIFIATRLPIPDIRIKLDYFAQRLWPTLLLIPAAILDPVFPTISLVVVLVLVLGNFQNWLGVWLRAFVSGLCVEKYQARERTRRDHLILFGLFVAFVLVIVFRDVGLLISPRFWAEDAAHVFVYAYGHNWWQDLIRPGEYLLFVSNFSSLVGAKWLPLEEAPLAFTLAGLLVQSTAIAVVLWGDSPLWETLPQKFVIALLVLMAPSSEEIWLNGNGTQYFLALSSVLVLVDVWPSRSALKRWAYRLLLLCAGLTGLLSCLLAPLFWLRALVRREREYFVHAGILTVTSIVQMIIVALTVHSTNATRFEFPTVDMLGLIIAVKTFLLSTRTTAAEWFSNYVLRHRIGPDAGMIRALGYGLLALELAVLVGIGHVLRKKGGYYLVGAFLLLVLFPCGFGIAGPDKAVFLIPYAGNRYFYAPNAVLVIALVSLLGACGGRWLNARNAAVGVFIVSVLLAGNGIHRFVVAKPSDPGWPVWRKEVARWRKDPNYVLHIWPPPWFIKLTPPSK